MTAAFNETNGSEHVAAAMMAPAAADTVREELERLRRYAEGMRAPHPRDTYDALLSNSAPMRALKAVVDRVAGTDATVLVWGESGVGKEIVTRALHHRSPRRDKPFVKVNCAALPLELLESELFGYERGAFTGAHRQKPGKFELAHTGTIFLDEIAEIPSPLQAKLLQVLQDHEFSRLGSRHDVRVDVRVIAATNKDLAKRVASGAFREDLYYRLNVLNIHVPPLRQRREEIPALLEYFLEIYGRQYGRPYSAVAPETLRHLLDYAWPGNVRELENTVKRIVVLGSESWVPDELVAPAEPSTEDDEPAAPARTTPRAALGKDDHPGLKALARRAVRDAERTALQQALESTRWHRVRTARRLKISYKTLLRKIREYGLETA